MSSKSIVNDPGDDRSSNLIDRRLHSADRISHEFARESHHARPNQLQIVLQQVRHLTLDHLNQEPASVEGATSIQTDSAPCARPERKFNRIRRRPGRKSMKCRQASSTHREIGRIDLLTQLPFQSCKKLLQILVPSSIYILGEFGSCLLGLRSICEPFIIGHPCLSTFGISGRFLQEQRR